MSVSRTLQRPLFFKKISSAYALNRGLFEFFRLLFPIVASSLLMCCLSLSLARLEHVHSEGDRAETNRDFVL